MLTADELEKIKTQLRAVLISTIPDISTRVFQTTPEVKAQLNQLFSQWNALKTLNQAHPLMENPLFQKAVEFMDKGVVFEKATHKDMQRYLQSLDNNSHFNWLDKKDLAAVASLGEHNVRSHATKLQHQIKDSLHEQKRSENSDNSTHEDDEQNDETPHV